MNGCRQKFFVRLLWKNAPQSGSVSVINGKFAELSVESGKGKCENARFSLSPGFASMVLAVTDAAIEYGPNPTLVKVSCGEDSFSFFLRDVVHLEAPIYMAEFAVIVLNGDDKRTYVEVIKDINSLQALSDFQTFAKEDEESWDSASARNRKQNCPTWLGIARDMRLFQVGYDPYFGYWGNILPVYHSFSREVNKKSGEAERLTFAIGQGSACKVDITRHLDRGVLPILHSLQKEDAIEYHLTIFATLENSILSSNRVAGTDYRVCYAHAGGNMLSEKDKDALQGLIKSETTENPEEVICRCRIEIINTKQVPSYAWIKVPELIDTNAFWFNPNYKDNKFDSENGFSLTAKNNVSAITLINGKPANNQELAILLRAGESVIVDFLIPHQPIEIKRAQKLAEQSFEHHLEGARKYWLAKLQKGASVSIPEKKIDEIFKAGLLHCDLAAIGKEANEPLAATIGSYAPIGTESAPIIQIFDSMGWHDLAERSLDFFLQRQLENGFIQNFAGYESETGPLLWTMGEHFRYTRDKKWLVRVKPHLDKAYKYLLEWRNKNKKEELRETGSYGLVAGKIADPDDYYHQFFLNAGTYIGLKRTLEMYEVLNDGKAESLRSELEEYKKDLIAALHIVMVEAPLVPTPDGSWVPFTPPWTDKVGATALYSRKGSWFSHGSFSIKDSLLGALYLIFYEIIDCESREADLLLKANQSPITVENAALSQPYYSRHDFVHLKRNEVKAFLKTYYNQLTGLIDQETYTFWEHYFHASQHKTHEEAWFLLQTRWLLYLEEGNTLKLFSGIPRKWLEPGEEIKLDKVVSYFGPINAVLKSAKSGKKIDCKIEITGSNKPENITVRCPHYRKSLPKYFSAGEYDKDTETIMISGFTGEAEFTLNY